MTPIQRDCSALKFILNSIKGKNIMFQFRWAYSTNLILKIPISKFLMQCRKFLDHSHCGTNLKCSDVKSRTHVVLWNQVLPQSLLGSCCCSALRWPPGRRKLWWRLNWVDRGHFHIMVCRWAAQVKVERTRRSRWRRSCKGRHLSEYIKPWWMVCLSELWS